MEPTFFEIEHSADWAVEVSARSLFELFINCAKAIYSLSGTELDLKRIETRKLSLTAEDNETLLVEFLSEILFYSEVERIGFYRFDIELEDCRLDGKLIGGPIKSQNKEIKAVTYHDLMIKNTEKGLKVKIVFDV